MNRSTVRFVFGFAAGAAIAVGLNLFPYWLTYRAYRNDGYEIIGFPYVFRRVGGLSYSHTFWPDQLRLDIIIAFGIALFAGCVAVLLPRFVRQTGPGFPISTPRHSRQP